MDHYFFKQQDNYFNMLKEGYNHNQYILSKTMKNFISNKIERHHILQPKCLGSLTNHSLENGLDAKMLLTGLPSRLIRQQWIFYLQTVVKCIVYARDQTRMTRIVKIIKDADREIDNNKQLCRDVCTSVYSRLQNVSSMQRVSLNTQNGYKRSKSCCI